LVAVQATDEARHVEIFTPRALLKRDLPGCRRSVVRRSSRLWWTSLTLFRVVSLLSLMVLPSSTVGTPAVTHLGGIVLRLNSTPSELASIGSANDEESQLSRPAMLAVEKIRCKKHYPSRFLYD
jgi:hypothetical protein